MKGDAKIIELLNQVLTMELTAINQYFLHARLANHWGYQRIGKTIYAESIDELKHAQELVDRILFLDGHPNLQKLNALTIGETIPEALTADLELEKQAIPILKKGIGLCYEKLDHVSRELLEKILHDEERHVDWIETQLGMIKDLGLQTYLAQQIHQE